MPVNPFFSFSSSSLLPLPFPSMLLLKQALIQARACKESVRTCISGNLRMSHCAVQRIAVYTQNKGPSSNTCLRRITLGTVGFRVRWLSLRPFWFACIFISNDARTVFLQGCSPGEAMHHYVGPLPSHRTAPYLTVHRCSQAEEACGTCGWAPASCWGLGTALVL